MALNKTKLHEIVLTLVNDSDFYNSFYPELKKFSIHKTAVLYNDARGKLQYHSNTTSKLMAAERSYLMEQLFSHYYEELFGYGDTSNKDLLNKVKPNFHTLPIPTDNTIATPPTTKEKEIPKMSSIDSKKPVQQVTYVFGRDVADMKDTDYYDLIRILEKEIKEYESIEHKPNKLVLKIAETKTAIQAIVALMDSKE